MVGWAFCKAFCWAEMFLEALCLVRSFSLPWVRARGAHCKTAAHMPKAKPMKCQWRGASGGRALPREAALGQRASCPLRQRRDRTRLRIGGSRAGGRAGARPSRWSQQVATLPAREVPVGKWWRNGCEPRAAATRKMRIVPVRARRVRRLRPTKITPFMPSAHFAGAPVFPDTVSFPRRHRSSR